MPQKLVAASRRRAGQAGLNQAGGKPLQRVRVQTGLEILLLIRVLFGKKVVVQAHLGADGMGGGNPVQSSFYLAHFRRGTAARCRVVGAAQLDHPAGALVLYHPLALNDIGMLQPDLAAGCQAEKFPRWIFEKVVLLDVKLAGKRHLARAQGGIFLVVNGIQLLHLPLRVVLDDHPQRAQHGHDARGFQVQVFPYAVLQKRNIDYAVAFGNADEIAKPANCLRGIAAPAQAAYGGHPRVVPAAYIALFNQFPQLPLAHYGVAQVEPGKLDLLRVINAQRVKHPVVQRAVVFKLQGADGVGNPLNGIRYGMGKIIHGINAPFVSRPVVGCVHNAVEHRVAHVQIAGGHVDLRPEHPRTVGELARFHPFEQFQVLLHRPVAVGAFPAGLGQSAAVLPYFLRAQVADVGLAGLNQLDGVLVHLLKVVRGVKEPAVPIKPEPFYILLDRLHIFLVFFGRVGIVEPQVAQPAVLSGEAEIEADRFGMPDMQVAVGFRGKPGMDAAAVFVCLHVFVNNVLNEIGRLQRTCTHLYPSNFFMSQVFYFSIC
ncbi:hypothetical protein PTH_2866 [Pelotomaculum thermopropionicum SI]|uniref:Uncharacterized protein n=1 Tax=Pelotomaculum thermopropionicum (strain DSM 13744 / JCM 10971 / SI) TaxID=370438 RepID=A5CY91_PELTS|nr:hypothetical protein PTH_2866 [Pelotomaculum thermopropionicum SI]